MEIVNERVNYKNGETMPEWVAEIPEKLCKLITEKLMYRGEVFGLFKACENSYVEYDIPNSSVNYNILSQFHAIEKLPGYSQSAINGLISFLQGCQQPDTGLFIDPQLDARFEKRDDSEQLLLFRHAISKYAIDFLKFLGAEPLYPFSAISDNQKPDVQSYLKFLKESDWNKPWGTGSHAGFRTVELFRKVNEGKEEYIPALCEGIEIILSKQNPETGMWGSKDIHLAEQLSGALKIIGRLKFQIGMDIPNMDKLADSIIFHQKNSHFFNTTESILIQRNAIEMAVACLESSDYRKEELIQTIKSLIDDMRVYVKDDGSITELRDSTRAVYWCGASVAPKSDKPRSTAVGAMSLIYSIGLAAPYLGWNDCPMKNPLDGWRKNLEQYHIVPVVNKNGKVEIIEKQDM
ncbi:MAG TPA: hypothetical protein GXX37_13415 [Clostridiaceae bacterium]|nr:hypothetical protein [Clostridiaceae bacterium]